jgi:RNA ligase (TIGR02306 family)
MTNLAYVGRITQITPVPNADRLERAEVVCGPGGKWWGVVSKGTFLPGDACEVFLQDAILPPEPRFAFLEKYHYRIRMQKLRGVPSEVLIVPATGPQDCGTDISETVGVTKYEKPISPSLAGVAKGNFPGWIPKTDEPNFQRVPHLVNALRRQPVYVTEKADGSSFTFYRREGVFGVCSRNLDLKDTEGNAGWLMARKLGLDQTLAEGHAIQGELIGPGIQGNPMGLTVVEFRMFNLFAEGRYRDYNELRSFGYAYGVPVVTVLYSDVMLPGESDDDLRKLAEGKYPNGKDREGIVIRPMTEQRLDGERISIKVINLNYKD